MARGDESHWDSDPLVRALRAPATPDELAGEADFVTAYRAAQPRGSVRRIVGRFGIGATTAATTIALSAGVAAAYGRVLPEPVQSIAHSVLGPVGVPAPPVPKPRSSVVAPSRTATATPGEAPRPSASATRGSEPTPSSTPTSTPTELPAQVEGTPESTPTASDEPTPTSTPTSTPTAPVHRVPAAITATVSHRRVVVGSSVTVSGLVTAEDGTPLRGRRVRLIGRSGGVWSTIATGRTDRTGHVVLETAPLTQNTGLRLRASHRAHGAMIRVVVVPLLAASTAEKEGTSTMTVAVTGGRTGDEITASRRTDDGFVRIGSAKVGAAGSAAIAVPTPKQAVRVVLYLHATRYHGAARTSVVLGPTPAPTP